MRIESSLQPIAIVEAFSEIADNRRSQGKRHEITICLASFTLAVAAGNQGFIAIGDWLKAYQGELRRILQLRGTMGDITTSLTVENIMPSLSLDLRKRIIETYEKGNTSIRKVAQQFQVSKTTVNNLIQLKRATGEIAPKPPNGGKPSRLLGKEAEAIDMVEQHPDYTLLEYCELWRERTDIDIAPSTMCSFLKTLKLTRKKKQNETTVPVERRFSKKEWTIGS